MSRSINSTGSFPALIDNQLLKLADRFTRVLDGNENHTLSNGVLWMQIHLKAQ